ncbi:MAG: DUF4276 family protein [Paludibacter sp.]|nr:DUF4276 family protein [Paludibacter sp.]
MARQIFIGLMREGSTDQLFLKSVIERTFDDIRFECNTDIDIFEIEEIKTSSGSTFIEKVLEASSLGFNSFGMMILCIHSDADNKKLEDTYRNRIKPAMDVLATKDENNFCKIVVAVIPIQETEAWMLADKELLKREIGTEKSDNELQINRHPEVIANPKECIETAIRIAREGYTKKRRKDLTISELYLPIGQALDLEKLEVLSSYQDFKNNIKEAFRTLNLLD